MVNLRELNSKYSLLLLIICKVYKFYLMKIDKNLIHLVLTFLIVSFI